MDHLYSSFVVFLSRISFYLHTDYVLDLQTSIICLLLVIGCDFREWHGGVTQVYKKDPVQLRGA